MLTLIRIHLQTLFLQETPPTKKKEQAVTYFYTFIQRLDPHFFGYVIP